MQQYFPPLAEEQAVQIGSYEQPALFVDESYILARFFALPGRFGLQTNCILAEMLN